MPYQQILIPTIKHISVIKFLIYLVIKTINTVKTKSFRRWFTIQGFNDRCKPSATKSLKNALPVLL